jgi:hypothetical protein
MPGSDILREMINNAPAQVDDIDSSIAQIEEQIDDLDEQIIGVQDGLCAVAASDLEDYLEGPKRLDLESLYGTPLTIPFYVTYGVNYGTINYSSGGITEFTVLDASNTIQYEYLGTNWDDDPTILKLIEDYAFGNDYLTRPLTSGATYGLIPAKTNYEMARDLLQENSDKVDESIGRFEDYAS